MVEFTMHTCVVVLSSHDLQTLAGIKGSIEVARRAQAELMPA
jgi:hypothetical protein